MNSQEKFEKVCMALMGLSLDEALERLCPRWSEPPSCARSREAGEGQDGSGERSQQTRRVPATAAEIRRIAEFAKSEAAAWSASATAVLCADAREREVRSMAAEEWRTVSAMLYDLLPSESS